MKLIVVIGIVLSTFVFMLSCTDNVMSRQFGGKSVVELPVGKRLILATWKENSLWYLVEDRKDGVEPRVLEFRESSSMGIVEGMVTFKEN